MKKILFFLTCIIGLLSLIGCSKDEAYSNSENGTKSTKTRWYGVKTANIKSTTKGVSDEGNLWNQRVGIYVKFLNEPQDIARLEQVKDIAAEWENYAGIKFHFVNGEAKANVRIAFDWQGNDWLTWSYTGTEAKTVTDQTQPTAVLAGADDTNNDTFRGDVLRLFGQILGLEYEQRHQEWSAWKSEAQLQSYWQDQFEGMNMDWDQIREYVFVPLTTQNGIHTVQTDELDELSIMAWPYYTKRQTNKIIANFELSEGDKSFIAKLYPKENQTLPTIQEAWIDTGFFEWRTRENSSFEWKEGMIALVLTDLGMKQNYLPDVSDGEQLTGIFSMFNDYLRMNMSGYAQMKRAPLFNTSNITDFSDMFSYCPNLVYIPKYNTSRGKEFSNMFGGCSLLTSIPFIDTSKGIDFGMMFSGCSSLKTIPLLNTSNGQRFYGMFYGCSLLTSIPLIDTSKGIDFGNMFTSCSSLKTIPLIDTSNGTNFNSMFTYCYALTNIPLLNTSNGINFSYMFASCISLKEKPILDLSKGLNIDKMYYGSPFDQSL